jgi:hypothetical protein
LIGEDAFERRRYMNVVVQRARHPQLRDYIHSTVSGLLPFIQKVGSCFYTKGWFLLLYKRLVLDIPLLSLLYVNGKENFLLVVF